MSSENPPLALTFPSAVLRDGASVLHEVALAVPNDLSALQSRALAKAGTVPLTVGIVDRDHFFVEALTEALAAQGWRLRRIAALPSRQTLREAGLDALLVDVAMVDQAALVALAGAELSPGVAIIACTEESTVAERVHGLEAGLDGWIEKPCQPLEAIARVQAIVRTREAGSDSAGQPLRSGELDVRRDCFDAIAGSRGAGLTTREFEILELLVKNEDVVLAREQIYAALWGYEMLAGDRVVDIFISRIRRKLRQVSPSWCYLHTHPGLGYRFAARAYDDVEPTFEDQRHSPFSIPSIGTSVSTPEAALAVV